MTLKGLDPVTQALAEARDAEGTEPFDLAVRLAALEAASDDDPAGGVLSVEAGTNVTVDATDPAHPVVSASGSGGSSVAVHRAPFAFDTVGLAAGAPAVFTDGYTPTVDDYLLNAWIEVDEAFDGTTPTGTASTQPVTSAQPGFFASTALINMTDQDGAEGSGGGGRGLSSTQAKVSALLQNAGNLFPRILPGRIIRTAPFLVWVNQDGTTGAWSQVSCNTPLVPVTVVAGVNDEFTYTPVATGVPETFTIAPGVYATAQACADALNAAIGGTAERFDTLVLADLGVGSPPPTMTFTILTGGPGTAHDGDLMGSGAHDAAADFGFDPAGGPYTFAGGGAPGADPVSTVGAAKLCVEVFRP